MKINITRIIANIFFSLYKIASSVLPCSCRFYPSCSEYSRNAICKYGFIKGVFLTLKRLLRCNPFFTGGYDPVE